MSGIRLSADALFKNAIFIATALSIITVWNVPRDIISATPTAAARLVLPPFHTALNVAARLLEE